MPRSEDGITAPETDAQRFARVVRARKAPKTQNRYANLAGHFLRYVTLYFEDFIESENQGDGAAKGKVMLEQIDENIIKGLILRACQQEAR